MAEMRQMSEQELAEARQRWEDIKEGRRCYGCGELFEVPLAEVLERELWDANAEHEACFQ